ncbi:hypothetical protein K3172_01335 [Qipengyuania sp. 6B39]|uniref:hypothetical protein n=1 Tax=Qipengyuania proteolytica TaxID=2867239 RepID=UPI001C8A2CAE|nr:hypothetical protein [Qipengyuania proteolytica]MBX7494494.1 hypothetical protein [Qipengyuania proteolytica]
MAQTAENDGLSPDERDCRRKQEAALISGEIVVCGDRADHDRHRLAPPGDARKRFAEETMDRGLARAPDFEPPPCVPSLLSWCSGQGRIGEDTVVVDFDALPEAPEGSDADRIAKGEVPE